MKYIRDCLEHNRKIKAHKSLIIKAHKNIKKIKLSRFSDNILLEVSNRFKILTISKKEHNLFKKLRQTLMRRIDFLIRNKCFHFAPVFFYLYYRNQINFVLPSTFFDEHTRDACD